MCPVLTVVSYWPGRLCREKTPKHCCVHCPIPSTLQNLVSLLTYLKDSRSQLLTKCAGFHPAFFSSRCGYACSPRLWFTPGRCYVLTAGLTDHRHSPLTPCRLSSSLLLRPLAFPVLRGAGKVASNQRSLCADCVEMLLASVSGAYTPPFPF
jgi:hypothetical protein